MPVGHGVTIGSRLSASMRTGNSPLPRSRSDSVAFRHLLLVLVFSATLLSVLLLFWWSSGGREQWTAASGLNQGKSTVPPPVEEVFPVTGSEVHHQHSGRPSSDDSGMPKDRSPSGLFSEVVRQTIWPLNNSRPSGRKGAHGRDDARCSSNVTSQALIIGDWGGKGHPPFRTLISQAVATAAGVVAKRLGVARVLSPGDAFYPHGVRTVDDPRFNVTFEDQFSHPSLQVPWYMALGNHDREGKVKPLMQYTNRSSRWNLPSIFYAKVFSFNVTRSLGVTYEVLFLDTNRLVREFRSMPEHDTEQWDWIAKQLAASTADWVFVVGHHPVYSVADRGSNPILISELLPLMNRHGVAMYFAGHDHNLQHVHAPDVDVEMFVVGAGSYVTRSIVHWNTVPGGFLKYRSISGSSGGFASLSIGACESIVTFYSVNIRGKEPGKPKEVYRYSINNPRKRLPCCKSIDQ